MGVALRSVSRHGLSNISGANEIGEPNGSQRRRASGHVRRQRAMVCAARWSIRPRPATCSDGTDAPEKRKVGGFDPAPDHQFGEVISEFSQLRGANWEALTARSRAHGPPEARSLPATKAAGGPMNILSGQRVTHGACTRDDDLLRRVRTPGDAVTARAETDRRLRASMDPNLGAYGGAQIICSGAVQRKSRAINYERALALCESVEAQARLRSASNAF